jgi:hypothetical protein
MGSNPPEIPIWLKRFTQLKESTVKTQRFQETCVFANSFPKWSNRSEPQTPFPLTRSEIGRWCQNWRWGFGQTTQTQKNFSLCWFVDVLMELYWCVYNYVDVLTCRCVDCIDVLMCWCVDVLTWLCWCKWWCWCVDDCVDVLSGDVLVY